MITFTLEGAEVRTSTLTQRHYRAASCEVVVVVNRENQSQALAAFAKGKNFSGLRVSRIADLSFLAEFENLRYLEVVDQPRVDVRPLEQLSNLRGLQLGTPGSGLDFSCFPELEVFVGDWHPENTNIARVRELRELRTWHFKPETNDVSEFAGATRLERLELTQTNITLLDGIDGLPDLRYLTVAYAPQLVSIDALATPGLELRELQFNKAKKIASYAPIARLARLRRLWLSGCAAMPNLQWARGMREIDFFTFVETLVEDGDLSPLLELPKLHYAGSLDKRHYSHKMDVLNEMLQSR